MAQIIPGPLYCIEDIVKNLQFLFPSMKILLYFFKNG